MNIKKMKKLTAMVVLAAICVCLTACGGTQPNPATVPTTVPIETTVPETTVPETTVPETTAPEETVDPNADITMSGNWADMQFALDGVLYQLPMTIKDLEAGGWTVELVTQSFEEGYQLEPGKKIITSFQATHPDYPHEFYSSADLDIYLWNTTEESLPLSECEIWKISLDVRYAIDEGKSYPMLTLGNGLKLGANRETVEALCGIDENPYESSSGYVQLEYKVNDEEIFFRSYDLKAYVYEEYGLAKVELYIYN